MTLTEEQRGTAGFDLEKARAMICHYRIENPGDADTDCGLEDLIRQANLAEEALDEIERLQLELTQALKDLSSKDEIIEKLKKEFVTYPPMNWRACRHVWGLASTQKVARRMAG